MSLTLTVIAGPNRGLTFTFTDHDTFIVGRSLDAHFRLPEDDAFFSRVHFLVEVNPPLCRLLDLKSRNGTLVNGKPVQVADLADGDVIQGGQTILRVALQPAGPAVPVQVADLADAGFRVSSTFRGPTQAWAGAPGPLDAKGNAPPAQVNVPGYTVERELGRGGMGVVYLAREEASGNQVALKVIHPGARPTAHATARFLREAEILRQLQHPHIVPFRALGSTGDQVWFAMDFLEGSDVGELLREQGPFVPGRAIRLICQVLEALAYAHQRGFVHRDLKPANLLVTAGPDGEQVRVLDFGLARAYQTSQLSGLTLTGSCGGTPAFIPPEQVLDFRSARPAADQYSAAATLYCLLTDCYLYDGVRSAADFLTRVLQEEPVPLRRRRPELSADLEAVVRRALARKPEDRYLDVADFRRALLLFSGGR